MVVFVYACARDQIWRTLTIALLACTQKRYAKVIMLLKICFGYISHIMCAQNNICKMWKLCYMYGTYVWRPSGRPIQLNLRFGWFFFYIYYTTNVCLTVRENCSLYENARVLKSCYFCCNQECFSPYCYFILCVCLLWYVRRNYSMMRWENMPIKIFVYCCRFDTTNLYKTRFWFGSL